MSSSRLIVAPCSMDAARHAVLNWHYSRVMPTGKLVRYGVWESDAFIGAVIFGRGASPYLGRAFDLDHTEVCELVRIALRAHEHPVSQIVAAAIRQLRDSQPGLRLIVSFADPDQGHHGGVYQAGNWIHTGQSHSQYEYFIDGRWKHTRGAYYRDEYAHAPQRTVPGKHRYLYPLDRAMRRRIKPLALPYPRGSGLNGETATLPVDRSGSIPENRSTGSTSRRRLTSQT